MKLVQEKTCRINATNPLIVDKEKQVGVSISVRGLGTIVKCSLDLNGKVGEGEAGVPEEGEGTVQAGATFSTGGALTATCTGESNASASSSPIKVIVEPKPEGDGLRPNSYQGAIAKARTRSFIAAV